MRKGEVPQYESNRRNAVYGPFQSGFALRGAPAATAEYRTILHTKGASRTALFLYPSGVVRSLPRRYRTHEWSSEKGAVTRYRYNMRLLRALFDGKTRWLVTVYEKEMRSLAHIREFERASVVKARLNLLNGLSAYRYDPQVFIDQGAEDIYEEELMEFTDRIKEFYPYILHLTRIECFDISNLFGEQAVGSMVVLQNGRPQSREYRKFRIKTVRGISDVAMMREVLTRRLTHREWPYPQFLLVDGGKTQVTAAREVLEGVGLSIPFAGLAKREEELIIPSQTGFENAPAPAFRPGDKDSLAHTG